MHLFMGKIMEKYAEIETPTQEDAENMLTEMRDFFRSSEKMVDSTKHIFGIVRAENEKVITGLNKDAEITPDIVNRILAYQQACVYYTQALNALNAVEETYFKAQIAYFIGYYATGINDLFAQETDQPSKTLLENSKRAIVTRYTEAAAIGQELLASLDSVDNICATFAGNKE